MKGLGRNTRFKKSKKYSKKAGQGGYASGGTITGTGVSTASPQINPTPRPLAPQALAQGALSSYQAQPRKKRGYGQAVNSLPGRAVGGTTTEVGKQAQSYKEYVKKTFGGGKT